jgi:hypothetical protein
MSPVYPGPWRIERNHKMHFYVVRDTQWLKEYVTSASGRPSSFKTWAGAQRAMRRAEAEGCQLCGNDPEVCTAAHDEPDPDYDRACRGRTPSEWP